MATAQPKLVLEVGLDHAQAVADLLDLAGRIHLGQLDEIASLANQRLLHTRAEDGREGPPLGQDDVDRLEALMSEARGILGHPRGSSFGVGSPGLPQTAKRGYEVMKAMQKALHDHLRPEVLGTVHSTGVTVRYASGDVPTARVTS